ncbi:ESX-1 secretion-associated protein EspG1 [Nocardia otitidiscaviarum]|uniref:ESX-1 secretion-associated protein EspG1 n=1 Tax=Nocardia otitidiscaviarum TaxID=1823 RepID=A0A378Y8W8_9NOCA|nr:ESX secretion-associated protein EspG [Nocardia otitidiscaviarum]SUA72799.1 ESX-1 secretion-associated protein EspG1 [Nocardia otitidiscaviarum]
MESDPVAVDLNVDAALLLQQLVGIDSYPVVLALMPNIYRVEDRDRVHAVVREQLVEAGVLVGDRVHPQVAHWLECLYRPDVELAARIIDTGADEVPAGVLRMSLVRRDDVHVLALRYDDHVVIQPVFNETRDLRAVAGALLAALGPCPALEFEPVTAEPEEFVGAPSDGAAEWKQRFLELGAVPHTAGVLSRVFEEVLRRAEVVVLEHHDGGTAEAGVCMSVFDTESGRVVATPGVGYDGQQWATFAPGDDATVAAGVAALVEMLPSRSWFDTSRV